MKHNVLDPDRAKCTLLSITLSIATALSGTNVESNLVQVTYTTFPKIIIFFQHPF